MCVSTSTTPFEIFLTERFASPCGVGRKRVSTVSAYYDFRRLGRDEGKQDALDLAAKRRVAEPASRRNVEGAQSRGCARTREKADVVAVDRTLRVVFREANCGLDAIAVVQVKIQVEDGSVALAEP